MSLRWWHFPFILLAAIAVLGALLMGLIVTLAYPSLPPLDALTDYRPKIPLRIYTADGALIEEFGEERRALVTIGEVPKILKDAILSAEDERFYQHHGVDYAGVLRAALANLTSGKNKEGASTITMQVARNFFLSREKTLARKFSEALLALKIEHSLSKDQILEIYLNQIYLGQRAYGFAAASQIYFGKPLDKIDAAEAAMLAGLPKAPSKYNPVSNPRRAKVRQEYVLHRMRELNFINEEQYRTALKESLHIHNDLHFSEIRADYIAEMVRQYMVDRYQDNAYTDGFSVYTTLLRRDQEYATSALREGLMAYDHRHGYRGPEAYAKDVPNGNLSEVSDALDDALNPYSESNGLVPAIVISASPNEVVAYTKTGELVSIGKTSLDFVRKALEANARPPIRISRGAIIRLTQDGKNGWHIDQIPDAQAAFVAMKPGDGAILALVGGFDYALNKFNHATQAWRQPGSSFKPFIYSAALEKGFTPASYINDAPLVLPGDKAGGEAWEPKNYDGKFEGPMSMRRALAKSKNLVSIRILQSITPAFAQDYISRFGFNAEQHPAYLTMALGAGMVTPLQMASAYSVFANGGYRIDPYFIDHITNIRGQTVAATQPKKAGADAPQTIDPRNAFIMTTMLQDVVRYGTATKAKSLKRNDLAGKTGTTNDMIDAWFCGFNSNLVGIAWVGFDQPRSLGHNETGGHTALPIWIGFMEHALAGVPESTLQTPPGIVTRPGDKGPEYFYEENTQGISLGGGGHDSNTPSSADKPSDEARDELF